MVGVRLEDRGGVGFRVSVWFRFWVIKGRVSVRFMVRYDGGRCRRR